MQTSFPKILLIGKNGQVGWELRRALAPFSRLAPVDYPEINLTDGSSIRRWVEQTGPDLVVNAAAYTAVDKAESEPDLTMNINAIAPGILAEETHRIGATLVHYSTDYVFDGARRAPYLDDDQPNPLGAYGRSKLAGDQAIRQANPSHLIFRLCWVYGVRGQNFLLTISRLARERERLRVVMDQVGCPTWSRMIAEATAQALRQVLRNSTPESLWGTYNLCAGGETTWHRFASAIVEAMDPTQRKCREVEPIPTSSYPTPARRPAYSVLNCDKLATTFGLRLPAWSETLPIVLEELGNTTSSP
jgi:dTDP-4-dehydrorhamnose reductase